MCRRITTISVMISLLLFYHLGNIAADVIAGSLSSQNVVVLCLAAAPPPPPSLLQEVGPGGRELPVLA